MQQAIDEAKKSRHELDGRSHPNVGVIVVRNGDVLASAHRGELVSGGHAEYTALERKLRDVNLNGAVLYTTLEPCTILEHPIVSCAERIVERGISKVVIGILDPNPLIRGRGVMFLKNNEVAVEYFPPKQQEEILALNKDFIENWQNFEIYVANLYRALDLIVKRNVNLAGNQIDILLEEKTVSGKLVRTIVECKFYRKPVGIREVRDFASVFDFLKSSRNADHAVLVSSSGFTKDAHLVAQNANIELLEADDLRARVEAQKETREHFETIKSQPEPELKTPRTQRQAFVIMPFKDEFRDIYILGIRETLAKHGYVCERADEIQFSGRVMEKIWDSIKEADLIIAEVTEHNPNVYYELGLAHANEKLVILLTKNISRAPFDVRDLNHIIYRDIIELRDLLDRRLVSLVNDRK